MTRNQPAAEMVSLEKR
jgi:hypothetical protein